MEFNRPDENKERMARLEANVYAMRTMRETMNFLLENACANPSPLGEEWHEYFIAVCCHEYIVTAKAHNRPPEDIRGDGTAKLWEIKSIEEVGTLGKD